MAGSLSLSSEVHVFPCPNCNETINTSMQQCSYCSAVIDHAAAESAAVAFGKINQACSDASYLKIMAGMALVFFLVMFVPILGIIGLAGLWFLTFAIPVMSILWWTKFSSIKTDDQEFIRARKIAMIVGIGSILFLLLRGTQFMLR